MKSETLASFLVRIAAAVHKKRSDTMWGQRWCATGGSDCATRQRESAGGLMWGGSKRQQPRFGAVALPRRRRQQQSQREWCCFRDCCHRRFRNRRRGGRRLGRDFVLGRVQWRSIFLADGFENCKRNSVHMYPLLSCRVASFYSIITYTGTEE